MKLNGGVFFLLCVVFRGELYPSIYNRSKVVCVSIFGAKYMLHRLLHALMPPPDEEEAKRRQVGVADP